MSRYTAQLVAFDDTEKQAGQDQQATFRLTDTKEGAEAVIVPFLGNQCIRYSRQINGVPVDVLDSPPRNELVHTDPIAFGNPILFPFPNRIKNGRFPFNGETYTLPMNEPGADNAIHGLVYTRPWQVADYGANDNDGAYVTGTFSWEDHPDIHAGFPFPFELTYTYRLREGVLEHEIAATNTGKSSMPMGFGIHPWFKVPITPKGQRSDVQLTAPVSKTWQLADDLTPTGTIENAPASRDLSRGVSLGQQAFDDVYAGLNAHGPSRTVMVDAASGVQVVVEADESFRELVIYAPDNRSVVCIEPYTCTTDAFNLNARGVDAGTITLQPGEKWHGRIAFHIQPAEGA